MRYSIGDVSRVLGMTTSALHFYEKEGIIDTPKVDSGRRYYKEADIARLISAKKYRAMDVPVRDIAEQFSQNGMTGEQVLSRMREKHAEAVQLMKHYEGLAHDIERLINRCEERLTLKQTVDIRRVEDMIAFKSSSGGRIPLDKGEQAVAQRWLEAMPAVSLSIIRGEQDEKAVPSLIITKERARDYGIEADEHVTLSIPGGMALHAIVSCGEEHYQDPNVIFLPLLAFAREHRFVQKGTMWGRLLFADCSGGVRTYYYDAYMCFE